MKITISELKDLTTRAVAGYGYNEEETRAISEILLDAQLRGNNQGVVKLIGKGIPRDPAAGEMLIEKETPVSARINGNRNHAMVVVRKALEIVAEKAGQSGFAIAGTFNTNTSSGAIGYVASELARRGLIGFVFGRSPERVAMHGSYEQVFGTNPLAVGIPASPDPIVLDMSTAATSYFGLVEAMTAGRDIPGDMAYDAAGKPTTSPAEAVKGAIRSFDRGFKGSALAMKELRGQTYTIDECKMCRSDPSVLAKPAAASAPSPPFSSWPGSFSSDSADRQHLTAQPYSGNSRTIASLCRYQSRARKGRLKRTVIRRELASPVA